MRTIDPALPRIGTDFMTLRVVMRTSDPALPRIGTDCITTMSRDAVRVGGAGWRLFSNPLVSTLLELIAQGKLHYASRFGFIQGSLCGGKPSEVGIRIATEKWI